MISSREDMKSIKLTVYMYVGDIGKIYFDGEENDVIILSRVVALTKTVPKVKLKRTE